MHLLKPTELYTIKNKYYCMQIKDQTRYMGNPTWNTDGDECNCISTSNILRGQMELLLFSKAYTVVFSLTLVFSHVTKICSYLVNWLLATKAYLIIPFSLCFSHLQPGVPLTQFSSWLSTLSNMFNKFVFFSNYLILLLLLLLLPSSSLWLFVIQSCFSLI